MAQMIIDTPRGETLAFTWTHDQPSRSAAHHAILQSLADRDAPLSIVCHAMLQFAATNLRHDLETESQTAP